MPDGIHKTATTRDSSAPSEPLFLYDPSNVRDTLQRQIQHTVDQQVDRVVDFSVGEFDGRFANNFPAEVQPLQNAHGRFYHIVGVSKGADLSVAAP